MHNGEHADELVQALCKQLKAQEDGELIHLKGLQQDGASNTVSEDDKAAHSAQVARGPPHLCWPNKHAPFQLGQGWQQAPQRNSNRILASPCRGCPALLHP